MNQSKENKPQEGLAAYKQPIILIVSVILGGLLGLILKDKAEYLFPIGQIWLNLLFVILVPLIFFSISSSIAKISDRARIGKLIIYTILIFIVTAAISGTLMFIVTAIFPIHPDIDLTNLEAAGEVSMESQSFGQQLVNTITVGDFKDLLTRQNILPIIVFTIFFGVTVSSLGEKGKKVAEFLEHMSDVFYKMVSILMVFAPVALACYFANLTGTYGADLIKSYGAGLLTFYPVAFLYFFVFFGLYAFLAAGPWGVKNFFKHILSPALTALGTRSSAAALPLQLRACDAMNVPQEISSVVCPMGATMHMDGACLATVYEIVLCSVLFNKPFQSIGDYAYALFIAVIASVAVSSVPGGGAAMETMIISSLGFPGQALPILLMMTQLFDAGCTLLNSCGDTVVSMLMSRVLYGKDWYKQNHNATSQAHVAGNN